MAEGEDRIFWGAVAVSVILHVVFFTQLYVRKMRLDRLAEKTEFSYSLDDSKNPVMDKSDISPLAADRISPPPYQPPQNVSKDVSFFDSPESLTDPFRPGVHKPEKIKGARITREISMPFLKSDKIDTPTYASYYQIVRERIRDRAYSNYTKLSVGEIYITFIIRSSGILGEMQVVESRSTANDFLREVGRKSVQEAAPFPPFPKDLDYPELTFNIAISFQYKEE